MDELSLYKHTNHSQLTIINNYKKKKNEKNGKKLKKNPNFYYSAFSFVKPASSRPFLIPRRIFRPILQWSQ